MTKATVILEDPRPPRPIGVTLELSIEEAQELRAVLSDVYGIDSNIELELGSKLAEADVAPFGDYRTSKDEDGDLCVGKV